jgi:hypothetical protein
MTKVQYIEKNFRKASLDRLMLVNTILNEYAADGYDLSLRQLYYQLVARDYIENSQRSYKQLGTLVNDGRLTGLVDWDMIVDRSRETISNTHWTSPSEIVEAASRSFAIDKWQHQPNYVEVMVEKDALSGVLMPVCRDLDIHFTANKGYPSASLLYEMAKRLRWHISEGQYVYILHLGDHDPSGIDMTRDLIDRLQMFLGDNIRVKRLALNMDQIEELQPPPNPAKTTDTRYQAYIAEFGSTSWELDAIEPRQLVEIVRGAVLSLRDDGLWDEAVKREKDMRQELRRFAKSYNG